MSRTLRHNFDKPIKERDCYCPIHHLDWLILDVKGIPVRTKSVKKKLKRLKNKRERKARFDFE